MIKLLMGGSPCTHWRPFPGHEDNYDISEAGQVRRRSTGRILTPRVERNGYVRVRLSDEGRARDELIHRAVARAFIPNPNGLPTVNHIDEDKRNNRVENLEWCDMSYQNRYGVGAENRNRAKEREIVEIAKTGEVIRGWPSIRAAATALGLNASTIVCVCKQKRRYKSTGGHIFRYKEEVVLHG